ncbi:MAG: BatA domain-containing protein, partial [Chromatiales bacterium]|nr:BatA domain-containing protein [Chromatiales bacterium]
MSAVIWQYPAALIALAGLLVPLVIHLLDRGSARQLDFAPLYLLQELPRASLRRLRLRERLLWLLRSLLVATAALLLASPALRPEPVAAQAWLLVQPGLAEQVEPSLERLSRQWGIEPGAIEVRWLDPELAPLSEPARQRRAGDLWGALLAADTRLPASARLAVIADPHADDLGPVRPRLSRAVKWLTSGTR